MEHVLRRIAAQKERLLIGVILLFHTVGAIGLQTDQRAEMLALSPMNLLLAFCCLMLSFPKLEPRRLLIMTVVASVAFSAEWIGVHTHLLFGHYWYGENLGWKWGGVPPIIGLNWVMLCYGSLAIASFFPFSKIVRALIAATCMTLLDVIMEPIAMKNDFWQWHNDTIPFYNYVCWWVIALGLNLFIVFQDSIEKRKVPVSLFLVMTVFFVTCYI